MSGWLDICASADLRDGGEGIRFELADADGAAVAAFAVRAGGTAYAYVNRCAHLPVELDWLPGQFFDSSGLYLICATHGALYRPEDGVCVGGPCRGRSLIRLQCGEVGGRVRVLTNAGEPD